MLGQISLNSSCFLSLWVSLARHDCAATVPLPRGSSELIAHVIFFAFLELLGQQLIQSPNGVRPPLALYASQPGFPAMAPQGFVAGAPYGDLAAQQAMLAAQAGQANPAMAVYGNPYAQQLGAAQGQLPPGMGSSQGGGQRREVEEEDDYKQYSGRPSV